MTNFFKHICLLLFITIAMMVTGCHSKSDFEPELSDQYIGVGINRNSTGMNWTPLKSGRADTDLEVDLPETIGVWGYNTKFGLSYSGAGEVFNNVQMYYMNGSLVPDDLKNNWYGDNLWPYYNPMPWINSTTSEEVNYIFYAYAPYAETGVSVPNSTYYSFNQVKFTNIKPLSNVDYLSVNKLKTYTAKTSGQKNEVQQMTLHHLLARLRFCFKLGSKYSELRNIHLKEMYIYHPSGSLYDLTINFDNNYDASFNWTTKIGSFDNSAPLQLDIEHSDAIITTGDKPYLLLSSDNNSAFQPFASAYSVPYNNNISRLKFKVVYDVYDNEGQLLRYEDEAISTVVLSNNVVSIQAGYYYNVNIKVEPTYLYALSDNDVNADGYIIIKSE